MVRAGKCGRLGEEGRGEIGDPSEVAEMGGKEAATGRDGGDSAGTGGRW